MVHAIEQWLAEFPSDPVKAGAALRRIADSVPGAFLEQCLPWLRTAPDGPETDYLLSMLYSRGLLLPKLCDPATFSRAEAVLLAQRLVKLDPQVRLRMSREAIPPDAGEPVLIRFLELLQAIPDPLNDRLAAPLLQHDSPRVRSKATLAIGQTTADPRCLLQLLSDPDRRVRASAIEALWNADGETACSLFEAASRDPDNRVAANAMVGLYRAGDTRALAKILGFLSSSDARQRASAVWAVGECGDPRFLPSLTAMMVSAVPEEKGRIFRAITRLRQRAQHRSRKSIPLVGCPLAPSRGWAVSVRDSSNRLLPRLKPIQFALWQDQMPVFEYEVAVPGAAAAVTGLLLYPSDEPHWPAAMVQAATREARHAAPHRWRSLAYQPRARAAHRERLFGIDLGIDRGESEGGLQATLRSALQSLSRERGIGRLLLVAPAETQDVALSSVIDQAVSARVAIDLLSHGPLQELALATGGRFLAPSGEALCRIAATVDRPYEIRWQDPHPAEGVRLEVYLQEASGREALEASHPESAPLSLAPGSVA